MGKVVMYGAVSVDGFVADENDQPGPLFDWLVNGDVPLDESGELKVSQTSYDYTRPYWEQIGATVAGRHVFDLTDGWDGKPPSGIDHVVVVTHRPQPEGWDPEARFHFVDGVEAAVAKAQNSRVTASSRSPLATSAARCSPRAWSTRCAWTSSRRVRVRQALLRVGPRAAPVGGSRRGDSGQRGASPALSGAPLTDLNSGSLVAGFRRVVADPQEERRWRAGFRTNLHTPSHRCRSVLTCVCVNGQPLPRHNADRLPTLTAF